VNWKFVSRRGKREGRVRGGEGGERKGECTPSLPLEWCNCPNPARLSEIRSYPILLHKYISIFFINIVVKKNLYIKKFYKK
jgi:hypothetical protein